MVDMKMTRAEILAFMKDNSIPSEERELFSNFRNRVLEINDIYGRKFDVNEIINSKRGIDNAIHKANFIPGDVLINIANKLEKT